MRVLVFSRGDCYTNIIKQTCCRDNFFVVTDAAYTFPTTRFDYYLSSTLDTYAADGYAYFSDEELFNIVRRDRYLRRLPLTRALNYVYNIAGQLLAIFKKENPEIIYTHLPDSCVLDVLFRIADKNSIRCCSPTGYAIPDYFVMFDYNNEVFYRRQEKLASFLSDTFFSKNIKMPYYSMAGENGVIKEFLHRFRALLGPLVMQARFNNPFNPDVKNRNFYAMCCATRAIPLARLNFGDINTKKYYSSLENVKNIDKPIIYISMHYYPETSIDYTSKSTQLLDHDRIVIDILQAFSERYTFIVKEHPVMYNLRNLDLYKKIKSFQNTYLLHPSISYLDVMRKADIVISWGGSVGLEAPFYGKRTLNIIKPRYHVEGFDNYFSDYNDLMLNFTNKVDYSNYDVEAYCVALKDFFSWVLFEGEYFGATMQLDRQAFNKFSAGFDSLFSSCGG